METETEKQSKVPTGRRCPSCNGSGLRSLKTAVELYEKNNHVKRNRKRMAWLALFSCMVVVLLMMFVVDETRLNLLNDVMTWFFLIMGSIVGTYIGFSSIVVDGKGRFRK
jgi:DMSO reductase anchor subunit